MNRPSSARFDVAIDKDVEIPLRDGVRLRADVFRPKATGRFPALINIGAYQKDKLWVPPPDLGEHRGRRWSAGADGFGDGDVEADAGVAPPEHLADQIGVLAGVAPMPAGEAVGRRESVPALPHPQHGRGEPCLRGEVADREDRLRHLRICLGCGHS